MSVGSRRVGVSAASLALPSFERCMSMISLV